LDILVGVLPVAADAAVAPIGRKVDLEPRSDLFPEGLFFRREAEIHDSEATKMGILYLEMAAELLCGHCGAVLTNPSAPCPRCGATASGAYQVARPQTHKNPLLAAALAIVPGCGHFYLGENKKGVAFLIGIGAFEFFGFDLDLSFIGAIIGVPLEVGGGSLWLFSIVDAYRTARRLEAETRFSGRPAS
jgi:TM2 domain-containing membrane protein YozV